MLTINKLKSKRNFFPFLNVLIVLQKKNKNNVYKFSYQLLRDKLSGSLFLTEIRHTCLYTSRQRGVKKFFRLSQSQIKHFFSIKEVTGLLKSSW